LGRRAKGEGSLYQIKSGPSKGKWAASVTVSLPGEPQKRKTLIGKTREHARQRMKDAEFRGEFARGTQGDGTVSDLVRERLTERTDRIKASTLDLYRYIFSSKIDPYIGKRKAARMTADDIDLFFARLAEDGSSQHIRRLVRAVLSGAYRWGMKRRKVATNPFDLVEPQRIEKKRSSVWNETQIAQFLSVARSSRLYPFFVVAISTGLRLGELIALSWEDVDLRRGSVSIQTTASEKGRGLARMGSAKTERSIRQVLLPSIALDAIRAQKEASLASLALRRSPYVFPGDEGGALHGRNVRERYFKPLSKAAKLPKIRFHDLRHSYASLALAAGTPLKVVSETLGHATPEFTARVYQHVNATMQKDAAKTMDDVLRGAIGRG